RNRVDVQACLTLAVVSVVPPSLDQPPAVVAGAKDKDVALAYTHALGLLRRLQLGARDRLAWLEVGNPTQQWDIEQHTPPDNAVGVRGDVESVHALAGDLGHRPAVVQQSTVGDVIQRVDMGVAVAVALHAEEVHRKSD